MLKFSEKIPDLAGGVTKILEDEHRKNADFREKFLSFAELCRQSINPELADPAIQKMLVQHLLTERIFRKVFNNQEFLNRNVIAVEIEKVIRAITNRHFSRDEFLKPLDRFYTAIEKAAESQTGYTEKQHFLNAVYEKFFQSFDKKQADTHGIVYTPQPIVDFMVRSVEEMLKSEFGKSLSDEGVHILDPFTGTGNFITRIMQQIKTSKLKQKYANELHCNEVMLLPYYIASMNIEHAYMERMGEYASFEGICLVDTFDTAGLFTAENTERIKKQNAATITLIIANPPYNAGQRDSSDDNPNRKYPLLDTKIKRTYIAASKATLTNALTDHYVRAFRWASDRIKDSGVICYVTNNGFLEGIAFDGMRRYLAEEFSLVLHLNMKGDARTSGERRKKEAGNIFNNQIRVGVGITMLVRNPAMRKSGIHVFSVDDYLSSSAKTSLLEKWSSFSGVSLATITPNPQHVWLTQGLEAGFASFVGLGTVRRTNQDASTTAIFNSYSNAPKSNNDSYVYSYDQGVLEARATQMLANFNAELGRWKANGRPKSIRKFLKKMPAEIKWIRRSISAIKRADSLQFLKEDIRHGLYRPFNGRLYFFSATFNEDRYSFPKYIPVTSSENVVLCVSGKGAKQPFSTLAASLIPSHDCLEKTQCFPFYTYDEDGTNRQENITDWALAHYRKYYKSDAITKWDIFHSTYALLHHSEYRTRYAANLKRELPRIPFPPDIHAFAKAGKRLMELHIDYEKQPEYPLEEIETPKVKWTLRVEKMSLSKDKTELRYNEALTLRGIPAGAYEYRLGTGRRWNG